MTVKRSDFSALINYITVNSRSLRNSINFFVRKRKIPSNSLGPPRIEFEVIN